MPLSAKDQPSEQRQMWNRGQAKSAGRVRLEGEQIQELIVIKRFQFSQVFSNNKYHESRKLPALYDMNG